MINTEKKKILLKVCLEHKFKAAIWNKLCSLQIWK